MLIGRKQEKLDAAAEGIRAKGGTAATHAVAVYEVKVADGNVSVVLP